MKVAIAPFLIAATSLLLPGCAQLLQGRFTLGLRHVTTAVLLGTVILTPTGRWIGTSAAILQLAFSCWSAYEAWRWQSTREPAPSPAPTSAQLPSAEPLAAARPWYHRTLPVVVLGLLQAIAAVEIAMMMMAAALSVMIFDAPGSTERIDTWAFFIGVSLLPVVATVLCAVAWGLHRRHRPWWAVATLAGVVAAGLLLLRAAVGPDPLW